MSALDFIPPTLAAASKKGDEWRVRSVADEEFASLDTHHPSRSTTPHLARSEIFQLVMDHLPGLFSVVRPPAKAKTGPAIVHSPQSPVSSQSVEGGLATVDSGLAAAGVDPAKGGNPPMTQTKSDLAISPDSLISRVPDCGIAPPVTELIVAAASGSAGTKSWTEALWRVAARRRPVVSAENASDFPANSRTNLETESSAVVAVDSGRGKTNAGLRQAVAGQPMSVDGFVPAKAGPTPANPVLSRILDETVSRPADSSAPAKMCMDLPAVLSPVAGGAPGTGTAPSASEDSPSKPAPGVPLTSLEDPENAAPVSFSCGKMPKIQKEQATVEITIDPQPGPAPSLDSTKSTDGTAVAQQDATMKMATKKTNFSGATQKLPGATAVATGENLPGHSRHNGAPATIIIRVDPTLPSGDGISANFGAARMILPGAVNLIQIPSAVPQYVERTREMISLQVMHVQEAGAMEMRVVIKPDIGLQLSLHLRQWDGGVEVQAVLERGNFGLLNRHWPELQQQLELRGMRVAPLENAEQSFGGGSEGFRQPTTSHGQQAGDNADPAERPAALLPGLTPATATASASTISSRHLETWA